MALAHTDPSATPAPDLIIDHGWEALVDDDAVSGALDEIVVDLVTGRFGAVGYHVTVPTADGNWRRIAGRGPNGTKIREELACKAIIAENLPVLVIDESPSDEHHGHRSLGSYVAVPLFSAPGGVAGVLGIWIPPGASFHPGPTALIPIARHVAALYEGKVVSRQLGRDRTIVSLTGNLLELITTGASLNLVLDSLARAVEEAFDGTRCSLLLLDGSVLRHGAAPRLPAAYRHAIDGVIIGPSVGSCGTAAFTGRTVIAEDIASDARWVDYRDVALAAGLRACWSVPIVGPSHEIIGTFALYYDQARRPTDRELHQMTRWVNFAQLAITRSTEIRQLHEAATRDPLTGLLNKREFQRLAQQAQLVEAETVGVLCLDIDQFKFINDAMGHPSGDQFLRAIGDRLTGVIGPLDELARIGGDEFGILCTGRGPGDIQEFARRITTAFATPIRAGANAVALSVSVGIANRPAGDHGAPMDLLGAADLALYAAKRRGRNSVVSFSPSMHSSAAERLALEHDLSLALANQELQCAYQPTVDLRTGRVIGLEVLARWNSPGRGQVPPGLFIPVAEDCGLIAAVGQFVLRTACQQLVSWRQIGPSWHDVVVWVNVSARQLRDPQFVALVFAVLTENDLPGSTLGLEVTESIFVDDPPAIRLALQQLRDRGVKIAIDDFGTGYSSLSQIRTLPIDVLKIDRQFVGELDTQPTASGIVDAILTFARTLGLQTVAEGIETIEQRDRLLALGCQVGQGYLWARPDNAETVGLRFGHSLSADAG